MKKVVPLLLFLSFLLAAGCGTASTPAEASASPEDVTEKLNAYGSMVESDRIVNEVTGVSFTLPADWSPKSEEEIQDYLGQGYNMVPAAMEKYTGRDITAAYLLFDFYVDSSDSYGGMYATILDPGTAGVAGMSPQDMQETIASVYSEDVESPDYTIEVDDPEDVTFAGHAGRSQWFYMRTGDAYSGVIGYFVIPLDDLLGVYCLYAESTEQLQEVNSILDQLLSA